MFYRDTIVAGKTILRSLKAVTRIDTKGQKRKPKANPTPEAVKKVNFRNAVKILTAKLNHNFKPGDYHLTLTYKDAAAPEEAKKQLSNFLRNMHNYCKRNDIEFKWVAVTEYKHTRIHHHIIMSKVDLEIVDKYWKSGYEYPVMLDKSGNYYKLAEYLLKETEKTFREDDSPQKRRYSSSRNVVMPKVHREKVSGKEVYQELKPLKGYYVDQDTVRKYEHAVLGVECMEYIMVSLDEESRLQRWRRGKQVKLNEHYKSNEEQLSMDELLFGMGGI